ncbi:MAG TPA: nuclear transport factor 2 family protein [Acidimicrobiia bacterium]|nr:nuclear transport factor 2 family protein [Acidimicrobiia bacterium]
MITKPEVRDWAERYRRAWVEADPEAAASLFSEDASYRDNIYEQPHTGRAGVTAYWSDVTASQTDVDVRMGTPVVDGDRADIEFWTTMTVDGAPVTLAGCLLLQFDDTGRCTDLREYWNFAQDSHPPPPGWGD